MPARVTRPARSSPVASGILPARPARRARSSPVAPGILAARPVISMKKGGRDVRVPRR
jgi:hypothetical protein